MQTEQRIIGIDPGTRHVGFGVIETSNSRLSRIGGGCINAGTGCMAERLVCIHHELQEAIRRYRPSVAAVETVFGGRNPKTSIAIGEGRGVAVLSAAELGVKVVGYEPALVKRAVTGSGRAGKEQVREMVRILLNMPELPETDHEADALALAVAHAQRETTTGLLAGVMDGRPARRRRFR